MEPMEMENPAPQETLEAEDLGLHTGADAAETEHVRLRALIEAVVYIAEEPVSAKQIAAGVNQPAELVEKLLAELVAEYNEPRHGLSIREVAGGYKMSTKPEHHDDVRAFVKSLKPAFKLSLAALETLAVIAYKQPITSPEIMEVRGVQGAGVVKTLLDRKLITAAGRKQVIGRPVLYKTTKEFLLQFGLKDLSELPTLKEFEELSRLALGEGDVEPEPPAQPEPAPEPESAPEAEAEPAPEPSGDAEAAPADDAEASPDPDQT